MTSTHEPLGLGQPDRPIKRRGMPAIGVLGLMLLALIVGGAMGAAGVWFGRPYYDRWDTPDNALDDALMVWPGSWRELAPGIGVQPALTLGQLTFTLSPELAKLWNAEETLSFDIIEVPVNPEEAQAASADLVRAIRDRDDAGDLSAVRRILCLLASDPDIQQAADFHLIDAVIQGRRGLALGMIHAQLREETTDANGNGVLHLAARHGHAPLITALVSDSGSALDRRNTLGQTPLFVAAAANQPQAVQALLDAAKKSNQTRRMIESPDNAGNTPLHAAAQLGSRRVIQQLLQAGANPNTTNNLNQTPAENADKNVTDLLR